MDNFHITKLFLSLLLHLSEPFLNILLFNLSHYALYCPDRLLDIPDLDSNNLLVVRFDTFAIVPDLFKR